MGLRVHAFNSRWWGSDVGVGSVADYFAIPANERVSALSSYAWTELRGTADAETTWALLRDGFALVDQQIHFKVGLANRTLTSSSGELRTVSATEDASAFDFSNMAEFGAERFLLLPGVTPEKLRERFVLWSSDLIRQHGETCFAFVDKQVTVQGWFLAQPSAAGLQLTLAMLRAGAAFTGFHLYDRALAHFGALGHRVGWASFSAANIPVLNIYSRLDARFASTSGVWMHRC